MSDRQWPPLTVQIGNAVPCGMSRALVGAVLQPKQ